MNKKILMGSLFSLMIILSVMLCANFVSAAAPGSSMYNLSVLTKVLPISSYWANVSSNNLSMVIFDIRWELLAVTDNATMVTIRVPAGIIIDVNTNYTNYVTDAFRVSPASNASTATGNAVFIYSNPNITAQGANGTVRRFTLNFTTDPTSTDFNATWNVTVYSIANASTQLLFNMGVDGSGSMAISHINVTDGTHWLYSDDDPTYAGDSTKILNGSAYLANTNTTNLSVTATVANAGTSLHYVTLIFNASNGKPMNATKSGGYVIMTHVGNGVYQGNITASNWLVGANYMYGPSNYRNASFINMSFAILANDTLNGGIIGASNGSGTTNAYWNFSLDGTYPNEPTIIMPRATVIYAGTSIKIICKQNGDIPYSVKTTTLTLTNPAGDTISREVPVESQEVEFSSSDIINPGDYQVKCSVEDTVGWTKDDSSTDSFKVVYYSTGGGGGAGGEGAEGETGVTETKIFDVDFTKLNEKQFNRNEGVKVTFSIDGTTEHKITWTKVESNSVTLTIESTPQEVTLNVGENKEVDVTGDGVNDINVKLVQIDGSNADVLVTKLVGAQETPTGGETTPTEGETTPSGITGTSNTTWIIIAIIVIIIIIIGYFFMRKK